MIVLQLEIIVLCIQDSKTFSIYLSSSSRWLNITGFLLLPAGLPSAFFRISHHYRYQVSILWMPGESSFFEKTQTNKHFLVSSSFSVHLYFVEVKSWGRGDLVLLSVSLGVSVSWAAQLVPAVGAAQSFQPGRFNSHCGAEISLYKYKYLKVFHAGGEIWMQGQSIKCMGDVALKCSTSKKSRIEALKGCADAQKVLQTQVFIYICSQG